MKTTLNLSDDLMRAAKVRAVEENRKLTDMITDLLRRGLAQLPAASPAITNRVPLPLAECPHEPRPDEELTLERVVEILFKDEAETFRDDVVGQLKALARRRNLSFKAALNCTVRAGLAAERGQPNLSSAGPADEPAAGR